MTNLMITAGLVGSLAGPFGPVPALAQPVPPGQEGALREILEPVPGRKVCFARTYDAAHLRKHPKQKVTAVVFQLKYYKHDPDKERPEGQRNYYFDMSAKVKGRKKTLHTAGECGPQDGGAIRCFVECDGGGISIKRDRTPDGLLVGFDRLGRLRMTVGCGADDEENTVDLTPGLDDRTFRLDKAATRICGPLNRKN